MNSTCRAFSLVEVLLALAVFVAGCTALIGLLPVAMNRITEARHAQNAALIASSLFAELSGAHGANKVLKGSNESVEVDLGTLAALPLIYNRALRFVGKTAEEGETAFIALLETFPDTPLPDVSTLVLEVRRVADQSGPRFVSVMITQ